MRDGALCVFVCYGKGKPGEQARRGSEHTLRQPAVLHLLLARPATAHHIAPQL